MRLIEEIVAHLFGRKYYANIINMRGTLRAELCCYVFASKAEAEEHRLSLDGNMSYKWLETVSFRSKQNYLRGQKTVAV